MARPLKDSAEKRHIRVTFRMNEREKEYLDKLSRYADMNATEVIRETVFKDRLLQPKVPVLDQKTYLELKRIGNNVNQIAKHLNSGITAPDFRSIDELNAKLDTILKKLLR